MKKFWSIFFKQAIAIILVTTSCKKPIDAITTITPQSPIKVNTPPQAMAGEDMMIQLPEDSCWLLGKASDKESNIKNYNWKKISGPAGSYFTSPDSIKTKVSKLVKGIYAFELTVTDEELLFDKDTVTVTVNEPKYTNEVTLTNYGWNCVLFGCELLVTDFYNYVPLGKPFTIKIKRDNSSVWEDVIPATQYYPGTNQLYYYMIDYGVLYIGYYGYGEPNDTPDIKISY